MNNSDKHVKVQFNIFGHWMDKSTEGLWCTKEEENQYKIDNIPLLAYGISVGDIIKVQKNSEYGLYAVRCVKRDNMQTYRLFIKDKNSSWRNKIDAIDIDYEGLANTSLIAISFHKNRELEILQFLNKGEQDGLWEYEGPTNEMEITDGNWISV